jgi:hypothetical protein
MISISIIIVFSGCPNQEIRLLFRLQDNIKGTNSYFGASFTTYNKFWKAGGRGGYGRFKEEVGKGCLKVCKLLNFSIGERWGSGAEGY